MREEVKEVPLKDVFIMIGGYLALIRQRWLWLLLGGLALAVYLALDAKYTDRTYQAPLTFVVNEESPAGGGFGSILGQFGLGGASSGGVNISKILALAESQKILNDLLLDTILIDGVADKIGNHIIQVYQLEEKWELVDVTQLTGDSLQNMNRAEKRLMKRLYGFILNKKDGLLAYSSDETTGIMKILASTLNESLSLELSENLYRRLSNFYTMESVGSSVTSVTRLQHKADSIKSALDRADYSLATAYDRSQGVTRRADLVRQAQLNREVQILQLAYGEVVQSLEKATFMLNTKTPFFQTVDEPFIPLATTDAKWMRQGIIGFFVGAFLVLLMLSVRKFYLDVMSTDLSNNDYDE